MHGEKAGLNQELEKFSREKGADLFGVADLGPAHDFIVSQGGAEIGKFPRGISMGMRLIDAIVDRENPNEDRKESLYWHHVYNVVTPALDFLAYDVARSLTDRGFKAFPIPASTPYNFQKLEGIISHKLAAHLSGLGWIGKSCLLLTKEFGPRVRFVTVLTDAPLEAGSALDKPCGKCRACVDACPVGAFAGVEFKPAEGREVRFAAPKCSEYRKTHPCGTCVSVCPMGKRTVRK
jgi:epoxyqueuosine reductase